jgi:hypothetical protein
MPSSVTESLIIGRGSEENARKPYPVHENSQHVTKPG